MPEKQVVSDLVLEQYHLGELTVGESARVRGELARSAELRARLAAIEESDRAILAEYPVDRMAETIRLRAGGGGRRIASPLAWGLSVAAMVLAVFSIVVSSQQARSDGVRLKGLTPHISVFRKTAAGAEELRAGAEARRGDVLQLSYAAGNALYGVILSIDGRGNITWHLPRTGAGAAPGLDQEGTVVLPTAYELDDAPGFERFFLVYGGAPFAVEDISRAAQALAARQPGAERDPLQLPGGLGQFSLLVKKKGTGAP